MTTRQILLSVLLLIVLALAACGENPAPIRVYVTPTQVSVLPTATETALPIPSPMPTETALPVIPPADTATTIPTIPPTAQPTIPPNVTYGPMDLYGPSATPGSYGPMTNNETAVAALPPSPMPVPTETSSSVSYGSIVGPNYTPMPTEVRNPPTAPPVPSPTGGPPPTPLPGLRRDLIGIQVHPNIDSSDFDLVLNRAGELGVTWIKYQFNWSLLEYTPGQYTELFYMLRLYVQRTHAAGFKVMVSVAKAPGWSRSADSDGTMREDGPPNDPAALASFLSGMLNMIGRDGAGRPQIDAIEVWNEPNLSREWHNHPMTGAEYMRYFAPAYSAIKDFSPDIVIITAAPAPTGDSDYSTDDRNWLQQLYNAGLAQYGSNVIVGVHPYGWGNAPDSRCCASPSRGWDDKPQFFFLDTLEDYHNIMLANGDNTQLWVTEFGWATFDGMKAQNGARPADPPDTPYFSFIDQWQQANYTIRAFQLGQERSWIGPMILWNLNFSTLPSVLDNSDPQAAYGVLNGDWSPRPVFQLLKDAPKN